jgi:hypothetical protein
VVPADARAAGRAARRGCDRDRRLRRRRVGARRPPRLACLVGDDAPQAAICRFVLELLELQLSIGAGETLPRRFPRLHLLVIANLLTGTPDVPVD